MTKGRRLSSGMNALPSANALGCTTHVKHSAQLIDLGNEIVQIKWRTIPKLDVEEGLELVAKRHWQREQDERLGLLVCGLPLLFLTGFDGHLVYHKPVVGIVVYPRLKMTWK